MHRESRKYVKKEEKKLTREEKQWIELKKKLGSNHASYDEHCVAELERIWKTKKNIKWHCRSCLRHAYEKGGIGKIYVTDDELIKSSEGNLKHA